MKSIELVRILLKNPDAPVRIRVGSFSVYVAAAETNGPEIEITLHEHPYLKLTWQPEKELPPELSKLPAFSEEQKGTVAYSVHIANPKALVAVHTEPRGDKAAAEEVFGKDEVFTEPDKEGFGYNAMARRPVKLDQVIRGNFVNEHPLHLGARLGRCEARTTFQMINPGDLLLGLLPPGNVVHCQCIKCRGKFVVPPTTQIYLNPKPSSSEPLVCTYCQTRVMVNSGEIFSILS